MRNSLNSLPILQKTNKCGVKILFTSYEINPDMTYALFLAGFYF